MFLEEKADSKGVALQGYAPALCGVCGSGSGGGRVASVWPEIERDPLPDSASGTKLSGGVDGSRRGFAGVRGGDIRISPGSGNMGNPDLSSSGESETGGVILLRLQTRSEVRN